MDRLRMQKKETIHKKSGQKRLFTSMNLRLEDAALVEEIVLETGRPKTQVLGDMIRFAYDHIELCEELYEEGEA